MFSRRLPHDLSENPLAKACTDLRARGAAILDLTPANPTVAGFTYPDREIAMAFAKAAVRVYEPHPRGLPAARTAIVRYYAEHGYGVDAGSLHCTASSSESYGMLFRLLCDPGDAICVPAPSYPLFSYLAALEGVSLRQYHLRRTPFGEWRIAFPSLEDTIDEQCKAVIVVNPSNPTGNYLQPEEYEQLEAFCARRNLALIVDEVFHDFSFVSHPTLRTVGGSSTALRFTLNGLSKLLGLPQMKLGWILTEGPATMRDAALARLDVIADSYLSVGTPVMAAAERLLPLHADIQKQITARCRGNLLVARESLGDHFLSPEGGWNLVIALDTNLRDDEWALKLLRENQVLVHPGYLFDFPTGSYVVGSLLTEEETFASGISSMMPLIG
ncbi:MAG: pyridoxal phosphate-dependent aminotransferase [Bacteroidetes bacterium]|nr:pyridoxal phosphate-dependent aminotransferase [Bacteroidota bacterium]